MWFRMNAIAVLCICLVVLSFSNSTGADTRRGGMPISQFLALWNSGNSEKAGVAYGYLLGTVDGMSGESPVCIPERPEWSVIFKRVVAEVETVKKNLEAAGVKSEGLPATMVLEAAFRRAYPCSGRK